MLFGPTDLVRYEMYSPIISYTYVDPDGTCRIYYGSPELPEFNFKDNFVVFGKMTEIRNVVLYYDLQPDNMGQRTAYPSLPTMSDFRRACSMWHFVDAANKGPKPTCNIIITYHGKGELPYDYNTMLNPLLSLMESLTLTGFMNVAVKIVPGMLGDGSKCPPPSKMSMNLLKHNFENFMGVANMYFAGDECRMSFRPRRLAESWSKQPRGGEATRARSRAVVLRHQRRAKRGLRNLQKI